MTELPQDPRKHADTTSVYIERNRELDGANLHIFMQGAEDEVNIEVPMNREQTRRARDALNRALGEDD